jgi:hyperosmotically inducible protein
MKAFRNSLILAVAIIGLLFVNVQAQSFSAKEDFSPLEKKVYKQILIMPYYGVFDNIQFEVEGSTVTLYGKVYSLGLKSRAENIVKRIDGVDTVINNIENLPPSSFDNRIRRQVVNEFYRGGSLYRYLQGPQPSVRIIVDNGRISLEGIVANRGDYNLANILARGIPGVFEVTNNLIIENDRGQ